MEKEELQKKIVEYYEKSTPKIQEVFSSMRWLETLKNINNEYQLNSNQQELLGTETMLVLLGIIHLDEYKNILKKELNLPEDKTVKIIKEIDGSVLAGINSQLITVFKENNKPTQNEQKQLIKDGMILLPKELQETIKLIKWENISEEISKKYTLNKKEAESLNIEIGLILIGEASQILFPLRLENNAEIERNKANKISEEAEEKIFKPIMDNLNENIKKNLDKKDIHWQQNLDFILSGGDYTAFIRRIEEKKEETQKKETTNGTINDLRESFTI